MNYPANIEALLGFAQVKELVASYCVGSPAREYVEKLFFMDRFADVKRAVDETAEFREVLANDDPFPSDHYVNILPYLSNIEIEGYFLPEKQLHQIRQSGQVFARIARYFSKRHNLYPALNEVLGKYTQPLALVQLIDNVLDPEGNMKPNASRALQEISRRLGDREKEVHKRLTQIFRHAKTEGWTGDTDITIRNGRMVLPIVSEHKRKIKGVVHDESSSGAVLYIEPVEIIELSNHILELQQERKREIERILRELTAELRPFVPDLENYNSKLAIFDFIRAKAQFALETGAIAPEMENKAQVNFRKAVNPLLFLSLRKQGKELIPLNINIDEQQRIIVISGPNAGGKSVTLKTVGLLQYMLQAGLLIPVAAGSVAGIFKQIFIDIGDGQSIEASLSTYSAHLTHMKYFTSFADPKTLILIDELGTGTDPQFGGPLAEGILREIHSKRSMGIVTTHYTNIKLFAERAEGMINASMAYDVEELKPLYRLETGKPGSSFAFEVAQKIGLKQDVINYARNKSGSKQQNLDNLLVKLESEKNEIESIKSGISSKQAYLDKLIKDYEELKVAVEENKRNIIRKAREEALSIMGNANLKAEKAIKAASKRNVDLDKARQEKEKLQESLKKDSAELEKLRAAAIKSRKSNGDLKAGDWVRIIGQDTVGQVASLMKNKAYVQFGEIKTVVPLIELEAAKPGKKERYASRVDLSAKQSHFSSELDLRGKRGDEALKETMDLIDRAIMLGHNQLRIVHGRGDGILRRLIRENLRGLSYIKSIHDEHADFGGDGVTIIELK